LKRARFQTAEKTTKRPVMRPELVGVVARRPKVWKRKPAARARPMPMPMCQPRGARAAGAEGEQDRGGEGEAEG